jgi:inner membrane protein
MENISHTLSGLAAGELLQRSLPPEPGAQAQALRRRMLLTTCAVGANLPDLDLVLAPLLAPPLGYLLHHRGHTHTLLYALPQALLLIALVWLLWPAARRLLRASGAARAGLVAAAAIGLLLHLAMDYLNSYGLHPLYPGDERWFYGDMVFIVEPVFWIGFGVPLALMAPARWFRWAALALLALVPGWTTAAGFLHWASLLALALGALLIGALQLRAGASGRQGQAAGMLAVAAFVLAQGWSTRQAKERVAAHLAAADPAARLLDAALTPFPANPLCWSFVAVERIDGRASYRVRRGFLSLAPGMLPLRACPAALLPPGQLASADFALVAEHTASLASLRSLAANCHGNAWLRFARAPVLAGGVASDARFGDGGANFTDLDLAARAHLPCPAGVPGWAMPRADLLAPPP